MNNACIKTILDRRTIRKYKDEAIDPELLDQVLDCAIHAPTAANRQQRRFTVLRNPETIGKLAEAIGEATERTGYNLFNTPTLIIVSVPKDNHNGAVDTGCAMQNIMLAGHALGLGVCWINQMRDICDEPEIRELLRSFDIPEDHRVWAMATVGYPAEDAPLKDRTEIIHYID